MADVRKMILPHKVNWKSGSDDVYILSLRSRQQICFADRWDRHKGTAQCYIT